MPDRPPESAGTEPLRPDSMFWFRRDCGADFATSPVVVTSPVFVIDYVGIVERPAPPLTAKSQRRRLNTALSISLCLHILLGVGLLLQHQGASFGSAGPDLGTGIQVSLLSGFAAGGRERGQQTVSEPEATDPQEQLRPETLKLVGGDLTATSDFEPQDRTDPPRPAATASTAQGDAGQAAGAFEGLQGASASRGGDPLAMSDILAQIARCLRPGDRPVLGFSRLTLSIGPDGRLRASPEVRSSLPQSGPADRLAADRIAQAALLCGPYLHPDSLDRTISLPADFSTIEPASTGVLGL